MSAAEIISWIIIGVAGCLLVLLIEYWPHRKSR